MVAPAVRIIGVVLQYLPYLDARQKSVANPSYAVAAAMDSAIALAEAATRKELAFKRSPAQTDMTGVCRSAITLTAHHALLARQSQLEP